MRIHWLAAAALATLAACGTATAQSPATIAPTVAPTITPKPLTATAELKDKNGALVATAVLTEVTGGVRIVLAATNLTVGQHGWHLHAVGKCDTADFASAGGHYNPDGKQHGAQNPQGAHVGDLGNLSIGANGWANGSAVANTTLAAGARSMFDADGTAIVIHAGPDDEKSDPAGNSGARIACGVVKAG